MYKIVKKGFGETSRLKINKGKRRPQKKIIINQFQNYLI
jgi:hypothetical protein